MPFRGAVAVLAAALALSAAGCKGKAAAATAKTDETPARVVRVEDVSHGDVVEAVDVIGELHGIEEVRVFAQIADRVETLGVNEGDRVRAGDLLATVRADLLDDAVKQARAGLDALRANKSLLEDSLKRTRALAEAGAATSAQVESLEGQLRALDAQQRQLEAAASQATGQRNRSEIRSPIPGFVAQLNVKAGDLAAPGAPLMTIVRAERLKAVLRVPERDFLRLRQGLAVTLSPLALPDRVVRARVSVLSPMVDRVTRTGLVEAHVDNRDARLLAGTAVRASIELARRPNVVLVPAESVLFTSETDRTRRAQAFVADGEVARRRDVVIGARQRDRLEIVSGLEKGEKLIVQGAHFLRDASPIKQLAAAPRGETAGVAR